MKDDIKTRYMNDMHSTISPIEMMLNEPYSTASERIRKLQESALAATYETLLQSVENGHAEEFVRVCKSAAARHNNVSLSNFLNGLADTMTSNWTKFSPSDILSNNYSPKDKVFS